MNIIVSNHFTAFSSGSLVMICGLICSDMYFRMFDTQLISESHADQISKSKTETIMMKSLYLPKTLFLVLLISLSSIAANAQWGLYSTGIGNFNVRYLAASGTNIFAATSGGGIYRSSNNGESWTQANNGLTNLDVNTLLVSGSTIFAATLSAGVFRSTNNGDVWTSSNTGIEGSVSSFAVSGTNIYAGGSGGVFLSVNNGANWTELLNGLPNLFSSTAICVAGSFVFAAENTSGFGGIYRSTDGGLNWTAAVSGLNTGHVNTLGVSGSNIFAGTQSGVYLSTNQGNNWTPVNNGLAGLMYINTFGVSGTNVFTGTNPVGSAGGVYLTTNNGTSWLDKNLGFSGPMYVYAIMVANNFIFAAKYHSVWRRSYTEIISIRNIISEIPTEYSLGQNYPNPFNPVTRIMFTIPRSGNAELTIFDAKGTEVRRETYPGLQSGTYEIQIDCADLNSGVYFYRLSAGEFSEAKRMILIK
jgi:photosystem II stability/assembly factor-like uncharacterized protein